MKNSVIILFVHAALFLIGSFYFVFSGNSGAFISGIIITVILVFLGFRELKKSKMYENQKMPSKKASIYPPIKGEPAPATYDDPERELATRPSYLPLILFAVTALGIFLLLMYLMLSDSSTSTSVSPERFLIPSGYKNFDFGMTQEEVIELGSFERQDPNQNEIKITDTSYITDEDISSCILYMYRDIVKSDLEVEFLFVNKKLYEINVSMDSNYFTMDDYDFMIDMSEIKYGEAIYISTDDDNKIEYSDFYSITYNIGESGVEMNISFIEHSFPDNMSNTPENSIKISYKAPN